METSVIFLEPQLQIDLVILNLQKNITNSKQIESLFKIDIDKT